MCSKVSRLSIFGANLQHSPHIVTVSGARGWMLVRCLSTSQNNRNRLRQPTGMAGHSSPYINIPFFHERGPGVGIDLSLQERLDQLFNKRNKADRVNIGFKFVGDGMKDKDSLAKWRREVRKNRDLEKAARQGTLQVDLEKVQEEWKSSGQIYSSIFEAAELYGIYEDLFREGYFYPCLNLDVAFPLEDDMVAPVFRGNIIKPGEAKHQPEVTWQSKDDDIWCLVLTSPDNHLTDENQEYVHWMVGNIKGSDLSSGDELVSYMQPFPPYGSGYHRYVFTLYKQDNIMDLNKFACDKNAVILSERSFNTYDFYKEHQDELTPVGLAFFQSDWDSSLRDFFHNTLNMKEPRYEYEFQTPYIEPWRTIRNKMLTKGFHEFLDERRDPKDIEKEVLLKKLAHTHPYDGDTEAYMKYPLAHEEDYQDYFAPPAGESKPLNSRQSKKVPSWRIHQLMMEKTKKGYYSSTDHSQLRRDPMLSE